MRRPVAAVWQPLPRAGRWEQAMTPARMGAAPFSTFPAAGGARRRAPLG